MVAYWEIIIYFHGVINIEFVEHYFFYQSQAIKKKIDAPLWRDSHLSQSELNNFGNK